ncbi:hypothetical protein OG2516_09635 [Oceanicola granulosus HTCC2516]|uniref:RNA-binding protein n=1 Tax=Oceanicola granulosus (strain ATCC BAA-861 / DSM 15982 / KCTC 12143 / HTCC2516) TaxID=314256 RepID=Q2CCX7_OCEGH|nr:DciA family protein [Oceanicola granulosus]EAR50496.1 hypothetical protein OG2516_09635 [Oceanicola granulosus HTCC2516]
MKSPRHTSTTRGFARASGLMQSRIRTATQSRGFAVSRLLTQWVETVGPDIAAISRPVEISYGRQGIGATLVLLTTGAHAQMLEMQKPRIEERVNAVYGYRAITRVRITQTAPTGFAEGQAVFAPAPPPAPRAPDPATVAAARRTTEGVASEELRLALEALGANVLGKRQRGT